MAYREPDTSNIRFVCSSCWKTGSASGGTCARCGFPQVALVDEVVLELRAFANTKATQERNARVAFVALLTLLAALAIYIPVGQALGIELFRPPKSLQLRWMPVNPLVYFPIFALILIPASKYMERRYPKEDVFDLPLPRLIQRAGITCD